MWRGLGRLNLPIASGFLGTLISLLPCGYPQGPAGESQGWTWLSLPQMVTVSERLEPAHRLVF